MRRFKGAHMPPLRPPVAKRFATSVNLCAQERGRRASFRQSLAGSIQLVRSSGIEHQVTESNIK